MKLEDILVRRALSKLGCYCMDCVSNYCKWKNIPAPVYVRREATFFEEGAIVACPCDECLGGYAGKGIQVMKFEADISCSGPGCYECLVYENLCLREEIRLAELNEGLDSDDEEDEDEVEELKKRLLDERNTVSRISAELKEALASNDKIEELKRELRIERNTVSRISAELKEVLENVPTVYNFGSRQASDEHRTTLIWPSYENGVGGPLLGLHDIESGETKYDSCKCLQNKSFDEIHAIDDVANYISNKYNLSIVSIKCTYPSYNNNGRDLVSSRPRMTFEIIMVPGPKIFLKKNGSPSRIFQVVTETPLYGAGAMCRDTHKVDNFYRYPWAG